VVYIGYMNGRACGCGCGWARDASVFTCVKNGVSYCDC
jgi:hypothetical protein